MANAEPQVPKFPEDGGYGLPPGGLLTAAFGKEKQVNIRMGKELSTAIAAEGNQAEVLWFIRLRGKKLGVKPSNHYIHRVRASAQNGPAIARTVEALLDLQGFRSVVV
jgi:hypothetical protein